MRVFTAITFFALLTVLTLPALAQLPVVETPGVMRCSADLPWNWIGRFNAQGNWREPNPSGVACFRKRRECEVWLLRMSGRAGGVIFLEQCSPRRR